MPVTPQSISDLASEVGRYGLPQMIRQRAADQPMSAAILAPGRSFLSNRQLAELIRSCHCRLRASGIERPDRVAVLLPSGPELATAFLGIASSAICVPLAPDRTTAEMASRLTATRAKALVTMSGTNPEMVAQAQRQGIRMIYVSSLSVGPAGWLEWDAGEGVEGGEDATSQPVGADLALILPTSGTTDRPKLALLTHYGICQPTRQTAESLGLNAQDCCLNMLPLFHVHGLVSALIMPLLAGGSVVVTGSFYPPDFGGWMTTFQPTWYSASPMMHRALLEQQRRQPCALGKLRFIRSGSAPLPARLASELEVEFQVPIIEAYGMTEVPQITGNPLLRRKAGSVGRSVAPELTIMDETGGLLPSGEVGEVVVRGPTVLVDYDDSSKQSFDGPRGDWFHTGDLGWIDGDGYLFLTGRIKEMINRGGQKISPSEIDAVLLAHPSVHSAVAFAVPHPTLGEDVVAAVVLHGGCRLSEDELRALVAQSLSDFKVPSRIVVVDAIPLGSAGKVHRRSLAAKLASQLAVAYEPPAAGMEQRVAEVFQPILNVSQPIGKNDNFFLLGGDSLRGMQVLTRLSSILTLTIPATLLFRKPTVAGLAGALVRMTAANDGYQDMDLISAQSGLIEPPSSAPEVSVFPLSFAQQRLWFLAQFEEVGGAYNMTGVVRLTGNLNRSALESAINEIVARHDSLRTHFQDAAGQATQVVVSELKLVLPMVDLSCIHAEGRETTLATLLERESVLPFNLREGPLLRLVLIRLGEREHLLVRTFHHIISDGWSVGVFNQELAALYAAFSQGNRSPLKPLSTQYPNYTLWQRQWLQGDELERQSVYWQKQLAGAPTLELATDRPRPTRNTYAGASHDFTLPAELSSRLKKFNQLENVTPFMSLLAVFQVLLARYSGQRDILVGTPIANRQKLELENQIGFFVNTLVMRGHLADDSCFRTVLAQVRETAVEAYGHQDLPFQKIVEEINPERDSSRHPIFQVVFALQSAPSHPLTLAGLEVVPYPLSTNSTHFDLELHFWPAGDSWTGALIFNTDLFDRATIVQLVGHYLTLLESMLTDPVRPLLEIPLLSPAESHRILVEWNQTRCDYPRDKCIHQVFEELVERTPEAVAVVFGDQSMTYRELDARANQLAGHLVLLGVKPHGLICLRIDRSLAMMVALLGILKAGGTYWALEENLPEERIQMLLAAARPCLLLVQRTSLQQYSDLVDKLSAASPAGAVIVSAIEDLLESVPKSMISGGSNIHAADAAYVSYTSGSTGQPKGVVVPHRGVVRLVKGANYVSLDAQEIVLHQSSLAFDASTFEIWGALLNGGRVVLMPPGPPTVAEIGEAIRRHGVTTLWLTAGMFHLMVDERLADLKPLRQLLAGGDVLSREHVIKARRFLPGCRIINGYGPTENTTFTCCYTVADERNLTPSVPIGVPVSNTQVYVLDQSLQPVPVGVKGELFAGGDGVACGYLNQPELTAERFVPDPFSARPGARLYRTGDYARWRPDGNLEFLGRMDSQVKIRGYRVELGELETALCALPEVRQAAVVVWEGTAGDKLLIAYLVANSGSTPEASTLRARLAEKLPNYLLPDRFIWLDRLYLTPSGKTDRMALPAPDPTSGGTPVDTSQPINLLELELIRIWRRLFQRGDIGRQDNFFALGGHSLMAVRLAAEIEKLLGGRLSIAALFQSPTVDLLARRLTDENWTPAWSSLVPLQPLGSKSPIFLVHGWGGMVYGFLELAKLLSPDQPVYGIQAVGLNGKAARHITVEEMATHYVEEIRSFQPEGPYYLAGYSMGGLIAFEIAQQLHRLGQRVALLAIVDSAPLGEIPLVLRGLRLVSYLPGRGLFHLRRWWAVPSQDQRSYLKGRWVALNHLIARNRSRPPVVTAPPMDHDQPVRVAGFGDYYHAVASAYRPVRYAGTADVFVSEESNPFWRRYWRLMVRGGVCFHRVPGGHLEMMSQDHLPALADALMIALQRAHEKERGV